VFNSQRYENSQPDGFAVLEIIDQPGGLPEPVGSAELLPREPAPRRFVPLERTELTGEVVGPVAALRLSQMFRFSQAQCSQPIEAVYRFPLPGDAAVTGLRVQFGPVEIQAELAERAAAEQDYATARAEGRQATLLTRESPDVFSLQVAGIQPDQPVRVETHYVQLAQAEAAGWSLRLPLTTAPRYVRGDELTSRAAQGQPLALLRDPGHRFSLDLIFEGAATVNSPTHPLSLAGESGRLRVRLSAGEVVPDRDCLLNWRPPVESARPSFQVLVHDESAGDQSYFLALVAPPAAPLAADRPAREVVLLVDHSGSMEGPKWQAADWAVKRFLSELDPRDSFNLGLFHNTTRWFAGAPLAADERALAGASAFLDQHRDSGGTELGVALEQALGQGRSEGALARQLLIVTDAEVSDLGRLVHLAEQESSRANRRRINLLCIDAAPNALLARELAERGGGLCRFLTSDPDESDIATALDEVLLDWAAPVQTGLTLAVNRLALQAVGRETQPGESSDWRAVDLGDLPSGRAIWVVGRTRRGGAAELTFRLSAGGGRPLGERTVTADERGERPAIRSLFGAGQLLGLELISLAGLEVETKLRHLGYEPAEVLTDDDGRPLVYAENVRERAAAGLRKLLARESLRYGVACAETAFVATRVEAGRPSRASVAVANALPAGWSGRFSSTLRPIALQAGGFQPMAAPLPPAPGAGRSAGPGLPNVSNLAASLRRSLRPGHLGHIRPQSIDTSVKPATQPLGVFSGRPGFVEGKALLFDSAREPDRLPASRSIQRLKVRFPDGTPPSGSVDDGLALLIFVDDPLTPRVRVRLVDLLKQAGERPLNLAPRPGQPIRIVLVDPNGAWAKQAPRLELTLE
jgi:Ca-activated chloride channel homolog